MAIKNVVEARNALKKIDPDAKYNRIMETSEWYIFTRVGDRVLQQPIGVNKETGEVLGIIPGITVKDYGEAEFVWGEGEGKWQTIDRQEKHS
jgi:hypothetical protein